MAETPNKTLEVEISGAGVPDVHKLSVPITILRHIGMLNESLPADDDDCHDVLHVDATRAPLDLFEKCLEFLRLHTEEPMTPIAKPLRTRTARELVQSQYVEFIYSLHYNVLLRLVDAASYLAVLPLLDLCFLRITLILQADSIADFKARIQVTNDLTPTEEAGFKAHYMEQLKKNQPQNAVAPTQA